MQIIDVPIEKNYISTKIIYLLHQLFAVLKKFQNLSIFFKSNKATN